MEIQQLLFITTNRLFLSFTTGGSCFHLARSGNLVFKHLADINFSGFETAFYSSFIFQCQFFERNQQIYAYDKKWWTENLLMAELFEESFKINATKPDYLTSTVHLLLSLLGQTRFSISEETFKAFTIANL